MKTKTKLGAGLQDVGSKIFQAVFHQGIQLIPGRGNRSHLFQSSFWLKWFSKDFLRQKSFVKFCSCTYESIPAVIKEDSCSLCCCINVFQTTAFGTLRIASIYLD